MKDTYRIARRSLLSVATVILGSASAHAQTDNTATGTNTLINNTTGDDDTATGANALRTNTTGSGNTATGRGAMYRNVDGSDNTATGVSALYRNTNGWSNVAAGRSSMENNTSGQENTAVGVMSMHQNTTGNWNTAVGKYALYYNVDGRWNTAVGNGALYYYPGGNVAAGRSSGDGNTAVGGQAGACETCSYTGAFGYGARATADYQFVIGSSLTTQIGGPVGWSNLSDGRYKTSIKENVPGLDFITKLRPVTFKWDLDKLVKIDGAALASDPILGAAREARASKVNTGFIAQEVEAAAQECGFDFSGVVKPENEQSQYHLGYSEFVVPLVKAVQEQQKEIEELREAVRTLAKDGRLPGDKLGQGSAQGASQYAGMLDNLWGGAMTLLSAALVLLHFKRWGAAAAAR